MKELQALALDIKILDADGNEIDLTTIGEDPMPETHRTRSADTVTAEDIGETVETKELFESHVDAEFDSDSDDTDREYYEGEDAYSDSDDFDYSGEDFED